jgi:hypothetical protein
VGAPAPVKYHYSHCFFTYSVERGWTTRPTSGIQGPSRADPGRRHCQVGSLAGAAHLLNHNAGVLRGAHGEQKSPVEQKGKSPLDFDFQCEYKP